MLAPVAGRGHAPDGPASGSGWAGLPARLIRFSGASWPRAAGPGPAGPGVPADGWAAAVAAPASSTRSRRRASRAETPRIPAGGRVITASSWYRQENSTRSWASSSTTAVAVNSRQARASCRARAARDPWVDPRAWPTCRTTASRDPSTPTAVHSSRNGPGGEPPVQLVGAQEPGDRPVDLSLAAVGGLEVAEVELPERHVLDPDDDDVPRAERDPVRIGRVVGLELPAGQRRDPRVGRPRQREQAYRVADDAAQDPLRLLALDRRAQLGDQPGPVRPGRDGGRVQRRVLGSARASPGPSPARPGVGQSGRTAGGRARVAQSAAPTTRPTVAWPGPAGSARSSRRTRRSTRRSAARRPRPAATTVVDRAAQLARGDQQVQRDGHDQHLADLMNRGRQAEDQARAGGQPDGHRRPPEQQGQRRPRSSPRTRRPA